MATRAAKGKTLTSRLAPSAALVALFFAGTAFASIPERSALSTPNLSASLSAGDAGELASLLPREESEFHLFAGASLLPKTRVRGFEVPVASRVEGESKLTPRARPGSDEPCREIASGIRLGLDLDTDLGWYYARNRWYDPETGSFVSTDPLGYPDSANAYVWGVGGPWAHDPLGLIGIFLDGTWNDKNKPGGTAERTNVARLYAAFRERAYYVTGVGTRMGPALGVVAGAFGMGASAKVEEAYWQVAKAYKAGDHNIDIFGFSRGAAEGRELANLIYEKGILDPDYFVTKTMKTHEGSFDYQVRGERQIAAGKDVAIRFLGLFDTVPGGYAKGSKASPKLGVPSTVNAARQARAADEHRTSFGLVGLQDPRCPATPRIQEKTFRGAHSDVGGGYSDSPLYQLPLEWMREEARKSGVPFGDLSAADRPSELLKGLSFNGPMLGSFVHDSSNAFKDPLSAMMPTGVYTRDITYPGGCP